jgi:hypothetical protein
MVLERRLRHLLVKPLEARLQGFEHLRDLAKLVGGDVRRIAVRDYKCAIRPCTKCTTRTSPHSHTNPQVSLARTTALTLEPETSDPRGHPRNPSRRPLTPLFTTSTPSSLQHALGFLDQTLGQHCNLPRLCLGGGSRLVLQCQLEPPRTHSLACTAWGGTGGR